MFLFCGGGGGDHSDSSKNYDMLMKPPKSAMEQEQFRRYISREEAGLEDRCAERVEYFDELAMEVERWAEKLIWENNHEEQDGWRKVACNSFLRKMYNKDGTTKCYLKWMKDSRGDLADVNDDKLYPCIIIFATINAPMDDVCAYLSDETRIPEYNEVVVKHRVVEDISPHSKICWGQSPQILFVKPRDFVTFCHHRWKRDGTQVVINQAVDHPDCSSHYQHHDDDRTEEEEEEGEGVENKEKEKGTKADARAFALRGANYISAHPEDPKKTNFTFIAHANPGGNIPQWASRTAVNAVAPIEPFKMIHRINEGVKRSGRQIADRLAESTKADNKATAQQQQAGQKRSYRPAGLAQMGYACLWPQGGGLEEGDEDGGRNAAGGVPSQKGKNTWW